MQPKVNKIWDVVVIGGGPAGLMAAGRAAELGRRVLLLEKNAILGKKLLITGGGRCNITNHQPTVRALVAKYKGNHQFLFSSFSQFAAEDALNFFNSRGLSTKEEPEGRIFPVSNSAKSVLAVLINYLKAGLVECQTSATVAGFSYEAATRCFKIQLKGKAAITAKACVVATGGLAHPETGSTGDGFGWLKKIGHTIIAPDWSLVPLALTDAWAKKLGGVTLKNIKLTVLQNGAKHGSLSGKLLFTHFGVSGPTVLNISKGVGDLLPYGEVIIRLDLFPDLDEVTLKKKLQALFIAKSNKKLKNTLSKFIPAALVSALLALAGVDGETPNHSVRREERVKLVAVSKEVPLHVKGLLGRDQAVVSSGGVAPAEVNFKTMESRVAPGLYLVGDTLNIDRPSGGYSLQLCWTTGFVAGNNC